MNKPLIRLRARKILSLSHIWVGVDYACRLDRYSLRFRPRLSYKFPMLNSSARFAVMNGGISTNLRDGRMQAGMAFE